MSQAAQPVFAATHQLADPRADGGIRIVHLNPDKIVIERRIKNVRMTVSVPVESYRDLVVSVRLSSAKATLVLRHLDRELDVMLESGDALEMAKKAKIYAAVFRRPISIEEAGVMMLKPFVRDTSVADDRRPRFLRRRKTGDDRRMNRSFKCEHEIIARN